MATIKRPANPAAVTTSTPAPPAALRPPAALTRERILIGGSTGVGKTYSFLTIVRHFPESRHVMIEVDDGAIKLLTNEFQDIRATVYQDNIARIESPDPQLTVFGCRSFSHIHKARLSIETMIASHILDARSWIALDGLDLIYNMMRYEYISRASPAMRSTEPSSDDEWGSILSRRASGAPLLEPADWDVIHSIYESFLTYFAFQVPCNLFATTNIEVIDLENRYVDPETKALAKQLGINVKFEGQKRTPRVFDTLVGLRKDIGGFSALVWKDRASRGRSGVSYSNENFARDIIENVLGYKEQGR